MGIRFNCDHCDKTLNVREEFAGRPGACPYCRGEVLVPQQGGGLSETSRTAAQKTSVHGLKPSTSSIVLGHSSSNSPAPMTEAAQSETAVTPDELERVLRERADAVWFVRPPSGGQFGPASNELLRHWFAEGRIGDGCLVWRSDWKDWLPAQRVFAAPVKKESSAIIDAQESRATSKTANYLRHKRERNQFSLVTLILLIILLVLLVILAIMLLYPVPQGS